MTEVLLLAGSVAVLGALALLLVYFRTAMFGLTLFNFFQIWCATLSAYSFASVTGLAPEHLPPELITVFIYSILGPPAMTGGIYIGWRPLKDPRRHEFPRRMYENPPAHVNEDMGWLTYWVGVAAMFFLPFVRDVATFSTAVHCATSLERIGLFILLISSVSSGRWQRTGIALAVFVVSSMVYALSTGHSFLRINALLPMAAILIASSGFFVWPYALPGLLAIPLMLPFMVAWMDSRYLIRERMLSGSLWEQTTTFFQEFNTHLQLPSAQVLLDFIVRRVVRRTS